jgi:hypothetical protein
VFRAVDRTVTPTGAQALWRWLAARAVRLDVLAARERSLARLVADPARRGRIRDALAGQATSDAPHLPRLLWEPAPRPLRTAGFAALAAVLVALGVLAAWRPPFAVGCVVLFMANVLIDDWASQRLAAQGHALEVLGHVLASAERVPAGRRAADRRSRAAARGALPSRRPDRARTACRSPCRTKARGRPARAASVSPR